MIRIPCLLLAGGKRRQIVRKVNYWCNSEEKHKQGYFHQWVVCSPYAEQGAVVTVFAIREELSGGIQLILPEHLSFVGCQKIEGKP
jgi:hypothetical protein